jgi:hypothetical protein
MSRKINRMQRSFDYLFFNKKAAILGGILPFWLVRGGEFCKKIPPGDDFARGYWM